jgi:hypothetical protein
VQALNIAFLSTFPHRSNEAHNGSLSSLDGSKTQSAHEANVLLCGHALILKDEAQTALFKDPVRTAL